MQETDLLHLLFKLSFHHKTLSAMKDILTPKIKLLNRKEHFFETILLLEFWLSITTLYFFLLIFICGWCNMYCLNIVTRMATVWCGRITDLLLRYNMVDFWKMNIKKHGSMIITSEVVLNILRESKKTNTNND